MNVKEIDIKYAALKDPFYFIKYILGYNKLGTIHEELINFVEHSDGDILDLEPRDHFKTTCITIGWVIWKILHNPNIRIFISHKVLKKSKEILREIKTQFQTNEKLRYFFGDYVGETWSTDQIIVKKAKTRKEPTISIGAVEHSAASSHYEIIINDDIAGLEDMVSEAAREQTLRYYQSEKYLRDKGTFEKTITIGTRWHLFDVYNWIIENQNINVRVKKAIKKNGEPYFPERYTIKELKKMQDEDPIFFESQMMNNPCALEDQLYPIDDLQFFDYQSFKEGYTVGYIDPAFGKNEKGEPCFLSFPIVSIAKDNIYVTEWITNKNSPEQNEILIINMIKKHNLQRLGIESNAQQSEFIRNVQKELKSNNIILNIESINHTTNKDRRIQGMHGTIKHNVYFRKDWKTVYNESMQQLILYPYHKFKDAPDALEGAISMITGKKKMEVW